MSDQSPTSLQRRTCRFKGHVQGVGFRYTTQHIAKNFEVMGFVRNLPDGDVEAVVEGDEREIDAFVRAIRERMGEYIRSVNELPQPPTGEFSSFSIRS